MLEQNKRLTSKFKKQARVNKELIQPTNLKKIAIDILDFGNFHVFPKYIGEMFVCGSAHACRRVCVCVLWLCVFVCLIWEICQNYILVCAGHVQHLHIHTLKCRYRFTTFPVLKYIQIKLNQNESSQKKKKKKKKKEMKKKAIHSSQGVEI